MSWITIFAVKFSFLFYFRPLVDRLPKLTLLWRVTLAICIPVAISSMCSTFIVCPYVGSEILCESYSSVPLTRSFIEADQVSAHCVTNPGFLRRERIVLYYSVVSDIVTDAMSMTVSTSPLYLLHLPNPFPSHLHTNLPPSSNPPQIPPEDQHRHPPLPQHIHDRHRHGPRHRRRCLWHP
jgi:hypothetical protein